MPATVDLLLRGPGAEQPRNYVFTLGDRIPFVIGRSLKTNFSIDDPNISRRHCQLVFEEPTLFVEDLSKNGTWRNDQRIAGRCPLAPGDVLRLGDCELEVRRQPAEPLKDGDLVGQEFHGYTIDLLLGMGQTSVIYRGMQQSINRTVAIKVLSHRHATSPAMVERFKKVARLAGMLAHPNIVQVFDSGQLEQHGLHYLVMEYVEGQTLAELLAGRGGKLDYKQAAQIVLQIGSALQFCHRRRIIHRDVNPANILITEGGIAKLAGLGLAKSLEPEAAQLTQVGAALGMLNYIAPEQVLDASSVSHQADIFGLGAVFYRLVTGRPPMETPTRKEYFTAIRDGAEPRPAHELQLSVPRDVSALISRALHFNLDRRYGTMEELVDELEELVRPRVIDTARIRRARRNLLAMLPAAPTIPGYRFATLFCPCEELGGDFYDFFPLDENGRELGLLVGDVSGHGIEAAVIVGMAKTMVRLYARRYPTTGEALRAANREILPDLDTTTFVTIFLGVLDLERRSLRFSRGGHNPLLLFNRERPEPLQLLAPPGTVIGMVPDHYFEQEQATLELQPGDLLVLYTDGAVEAMNAEEQFFDLERLKAMVGQYQPGDPLEPFLERIHQAVRDFTGGGAQEDDITLVALAVE